MQRHLPVRLVIFGLAVFLSRCPIWAADDYQPGPDSTEHEGVPKGEIIKGVFEESKVFPGTVRDYWVYVPKQLDASKAAPTMIFQDGIQYKAPQVFDNLIHRKEIPALVGVFIMHGRVKPYSSNAL